METLQLVEEIEALSEPARATVEQLVVLLGQQGSPRPLPPVVRVSRPLTEADLAAEQAETGGWAARTDITDGAEYIHQVRRGLRQP